MPARVPPGKISPGPQAWHFSPSPSLTPVAPTVTLYHTADCHLCEEVLALLERLRRDIVFDLRLIDIADDPVAYSRYRHVIPVIWINGREAGRYPIDAAALRAALQTGGASA
jgi:glutaredoxin